MKKINWLEVAKVIVSLLAGILGGGTYQAIM